MQRYEVPLSITVKQGWQAHHIIKGTKGLERLGRWCQITGINISTPLLTGLFSAVVPQLLQCTALKKLELCGNRIAPGDIDALCSLVARCSSLVQLRLPSTGLGCAGAQGLAVVLTHRTLTSLDLRDNGIKEEGMLALGEFLGRCRTLKELCLQGNACGDAGLAKLVRNLGSSTAVLTRLDLRNIMIGHEGIAALAALFCKLTALQEIKLAKNRTGYEEIGTLLTALSTRSSLTSLTIDCMSLRQDEVAKLPQVLDGCKSLSMLRLKKTDLWATDHEIAGGSSDVPLQLTYLDLSFNDLHGMHWNRYKKLLQRSVLLQDLNLSSNILSLKGCALLASLPPYSLLTRLRLKNCGLGKYGRIIAFAEILPTYTALKSLDLCANDLLENSAKCLAEALGKCAQLAELYLGQNKIGKVGACLLMPALSQCSSLVVLQLSNNEIRDEGANALAHFLYNSPRMQDLNLCENMITHVGIENLAVALETCTALTNLDLSKNALCSKGMRVLAPALAGCTSLKLLNLQACELRERGVNLLAGALADYPALTMLNLSKNYTGEEGANRLAGVLAACPSLQILQFHANYFWGEDRDVLEAAVRTLPEGKHVRVLG